MERLIISVVVVALAGLVALAVQRRRPGEVETTGWAVPSHLRREDFDRPPARWLIAVFTELTCRTCAAAVQAAKSLAADDVAVQEVERSAEQALHDRYGIDAVPTVVVADAAGVVRASFVGPPPAADLATAIADLRRGRLPTEED